MFFLAYILEISIVVENENWSLSISYSIASSSASDWWLTSSPGSSRNFNGSPTRHNVHAWSIVEKPFKSVESTKSNTPASLNKRYDKITLECTRTFARSNSAFQAFQRSCTQRSMTFTVELENLTFCLLWIESLLKRLNAWSSSSASDVTKVAKSPNSDVIGCWQLSNTKGMYDYIFKRVITGTP